MDSERTLRKAKQQGDGPRPGRPVRGSSSGRPLLAAFDLLGRRWALRVVWELRDGPVGARELRSRCDDVSPSVLYDRLRELVEAGLVERDDDRRYRLSAVGADLEGALRPLGAWADRWAGASLPEADQT
jgi:DNA-binding HxlR family transcriptional regulator